MATSGLDTDQLQALRDRVEADFRRAEEDYRRAEENYRLDTAAIEHLQRRFFGGNSSITYAAPTNGFKTEVPAAMQPPPSTSAEQKHDEWAIFKNRK